MSIAARAVLVLLLLAAAGVLGWRQGVRSTLADWRAADLATERQAAEQLQRARERADAASQAHEAERQQIATNLREARRALQSALRAPVAQCQQHPGLPGLVLGDVLLPAAAFDGLRHAAGGAKNEQPAAAEPGPALQPGPADPGS